MTNKTLTEILTLKNPAFSAYVATSCLLVIKMIAVSFLTVYKRRVHKTYISTEDLKLSDKAELGTNDAVERVRRAHLNDLENIPMFWAAAFAYLFTKPPVGLACFLFFGFTLVRLGHTFVYAVVVIRQPARAICFLAGLFITLYMALHAMIVGFIHL